VHGGGRHVLGPVAGRGDGQIAGRTLSRERLVYVLDGRVSSSDGTATREIAKEMLIVMRPDGR
jgi:hypothetical protein